MKTLILILNITGVLFLFGVIKVLLRTNPELAIAILLSSAVLLALYWKLIKDK